MNGTTTMTEMMFMGTMEFGRPDPQTVSFYRYKTRIFKLITRHG